MNQWGMEGVITILVLMVDQRMDHKMDHRKKKG